MDLDVIVIGSGQAGVPLAALLAESGRRVLLAESGALGGTCVNHGCTPTKTMIASARASHVARTAGRLGVRARDVSVDFEAVVDRKDRIVGQWRDGVRRRLEKAGANLRLVEGRARFVGEREIEVNGERHRADRVIVNVGARPEMPRIEGLEEVGPLTNETILALRALPDRLVILGGGYVGCEFGQMFRRFGSEVLIVQRGPHLLDREDPEISEVIEEVFRDEGIEVRLGAEARSARRSAEDVVVGLEDGSEVRGSHLLVATGRRPNTESLGLEAAGIEVDDRGAVIVDDGYRTTAAEVYAVGDVTGGPQFTHTSWDDGRILIDRLTGRGERGRSGRLVPYTVFTDPQVARVGLSEREAKERGVEHEVASMPFGRIARAVETDEPAGTAKVLIDPGSERILGASLVGKDAGELIHIFVVLMQAEASARAIVDAQFVHPTLAEGMQTLLMRLERYAL